MFILELRPAVNKHVFGIFRVPDKTINCFDYNKYVPISIAARSCALSSGVVDSNRARRTRVLSVVSIYFPKVQALLCFDPLS